MWEILVGLRSFRKQHPMALHYYILHFLSTVSYSEGNDQIVDFTESLRNSNLQSYIQSPHYQNSVSATFFFPEGFYIQPFPRVPQVFFRRVSSPQFLSKYSSQFFLFSQSQFLSSPSLQSSYRVSSLWFLHRVISLPSIEEFKRASIAPLE